MASLNKKFAQEKAQAEGERASLVAKIEASEQAAASLREQVKGTQAAADKDKVDFSAQLASKNSEIAQLHDQLKEQANHSEKL